MNFLSFFVAAGYGVCNATISNKICAYREECQTNDAERSEYEMMQEVNRLRQELLEAKKGNDFLKKLRHSLRRKSINGISIYRTEQKKLDYDGS